MSYTTDIESGYCKIVNGYYVSECGYQEKLEWRLQEGMMLHMSSVTLVLHQNGDQMKMIHRCLNFCFFEEEDEDVSKEEDLDSTRASTGALLVGAVITVLSSSSSTCSLTINGEQRAH